MSLQRSWCQSEQSTCEKSDAGSVPFRAYIFMQSITPPIHCCVRSKRRHSSISRFFSDGRLHWSGSGRLVLAEWAKSHSPPDWDLDCSVANPVGWWSWLSQLTVAQPSHGHSGLGHCLAGRWRSHQRLNEWLAVTEICDSSLKKIENLVSRTWDSYETWRRWQK